MHRGHLTSDPRFRASVSPPPGDPGGPSGPDAIMTAMDTATRRLTGAQILVEHLVNEGVTLAAGIPGHGC